MTDPHAPSGVCQVCGGGHWTWTDHHGVARCRHCETTSYMLPAALPEAKKDQPLPLSTLKAEWLPKYQAWWQTTHGELTFGEWQKAGEKPMSAEDLMAFRAAKEKKRVEDVIARPLVHIKEWPGMTKDGRQIYHVGLYGPKIDGKYLGETADIEVARALGRAAASAIEAVLGHPVSVVTQRGQGFSQWLDQDDFWACHPTLGVQYDRPGWTAYLRDPYGHWMRIAHTDSSPLFDAPTPEAAVAGLLDQIRGQDIYFTGYHSGAFHVPSDLVMDWKPGQAKPEKAPSSGKATS